SVLTTAASLVGVKVKRSNRKVGVMPPQIWQSGYTEKFMRGYPAHKVVPARFKDKPHEQW
ncbi:unnamed protein product, partial [Chrysoparadoxa australica]